MTREAAVRRYQAIKRREKATAVHQARLQSLRDGLAQAGLTQDERVLRRVLAWREKRGVA